MLELIIGAPARAPGGAMSSRQPAGSALRHPAFTTGAVAERSSLTPTDLGQTVVDVHWFASERTRPGSAPGLGVSSVLALLMLLWIGAVASRAATPELDVVDLLLRLRGHVRTQYETIQERVQSVRDRRLSAGELRGDVDDFEKRFKSLEDLFPRATVRLPQHVDLIQDIRREVGQYRSDVRRMAREVGVMVTDGPTAGALLHREESDYRSLRGQLESFMEKMREPEPVSLPTPRPMPVAVIKAPLVTAVAAAAPVALPAAPAAALSLPSPSSPARVSDPIRARLEQIVARGKSRAALSSTPLAPPAPLARSPEPVVRTSARPVAAAGRLVLRAPTRTRPASPSPALPEPKVETRAPTPAVRATPALDSVLAQIRARAQKPTEASGTDDTEENETDSESPLATAPALPRSPVQSSEKNDVTPERVRSIVARLRAQKAPKAQQPRPVGPEETEPSDGSESADPADDEAPARAVVAVPVTAPATAGIKQVSEHSNRPTAPRRRGISVVQGPAPVQSPAPAQSSSPADPLARQVEQVSRQLSLLTVRMEQMARQKAAPAPVRTVAAPVIAPSPKPLPAPVTLASESFRSPTTPAMTPATASASANLAARARALARMPPPRKVAPPLTPVVSGPRVTLMKSGPEEADTGDENDEDESTPKVKPDLAAENMAVLKKLFAQDSQVASVAAVDDQSGAEDIGLRPTRPKPLRAPAPSAVRVQSVLDSIRTQRDRSPPVHVHRPSVQAAPVDDAPALEDVPRWTRKSARSSVPFHEAAWGPSPQPIPRRAPGVEVVASPPATVPRPRPAAPTPTAQETRRRAIQALEKLRGLARTKGAARDLPQLAEEETDDTSTEPSPKAPRPVGPAGHLALVGRPEISPTRPKAPPLTGPTSPRQPFRVASRSSDETDEGDGDEVASDATPAPSAPVPRAAPQLSAGAGNASVRPPRFTGHRPAPRFPRAPAPMVEPPFEDDAEEQGAPAPTSASRLRRVLGRLDELRGPSARTVQATRAPTKPAPDMARAPAQESPEAGETAARALRQGPLQLVHRSWSAPAPLTGHPRPLVAPSAPAVAPLTAAAPLRPSRVFSQADFSEPTPRAPAAAVAAPSLMYSYKAPAPARTLPQRSSFVPVGSVRSPINDMVDADSIRLLGPRGAPAPWLGADEVPAAGPPAQMPPIPVALPAMPPIPVSLPGSPPGAFAAGPAGGVVQPPGPVGAPEPVAPGLFAGPSDRTRLAAGPGGAVGFEVLDDRAGEVAELLGSDASSLAATDSGVFSYSQELVVNIIKDLTTAAQINLIIRGVIPSKMDLDINDRSPREVLLFVLDTQDLEYEYTQKSNTLIVYGTGGKVREVTRTYKFSNQLIVPLEEIKRAIEVNILTRAPKESTGGEGDKGGGGAGGAAGGPGAGGPGGAPGGPPGGPPGGAGGPPGGGAAGAPAGGSDATAGPTGPP